MCFENIWKLLADNSSSVIAICALALTIWQAYITRQHNKLSVAPYLTTWSHADVDNGFYSIEIMNNGIGPALIKTFLVYIDGVEIKGQESETVEKATAILFGNYPYASGNGFLNKGYMMAEKSKHGILSIRFTGANRPNYQEFQQTIKRARLLIEYESAYKEKFSYDSDNFGILN
ncbi:MAG: hypothetical protein WBL28_00545 [Methylotenera sp.]